MQKVKSSRIKKNRFVLIIIAILAMSHATISVSSASTGEEGHAQRRVDTTDVRKSTDIKAAGAIKAKSSHEKEKSEAVKHESEGESVKGSVSAEGEKIGKEIISTEHGVAEGGEEHHPAWMIPGWQTIFTILAVGYYALAVAVLPKIMAKEEHH